MSHEDIFVTLPYNTWENKYLKQASEIARLETELASRDAEVVVSISVANLGYRRIHVGSVDVSAQFLFISDQQPWKEELSRSLDIFIKDQMRKMLNEKYYSRSEVEELRLELRCREEELEGRLQKVTSRNIHVGRRIGKIPRWLRWLYKIK